MTTEREYRQRQYIRAKKQRSQANLCGWLIVTTLGFINLSYWNTNSSDFLNNKTLFQVTLPEFPSRRYQPIEFGNTQLILQQDFQSIDSIAAHINYQGTSVKHLAALLSQSAHSDLEKARIIYAWITQNISYDVESLIRVTEGGKYPDVSPQTVLENRTTICSGYSNLYWALAQQMNLDTVIILGYAKGITTRDNYNTDINHAWNGVKIDGSWYLVDATWGAGYVNEYQFIPKFKPYYFATPPSELIYSHFPQDSGWQLLNQTYSRAKFEQLPVRYPDDF